MFPSLLVSISRGRGRHLKELHLDLGADLAGRHNLPALDIDQLMPFAALLAAGELPNLQTLDLDMTWKKGAVAVLADGLR